MYEPTHMDSQVFWTGEELYSDEVKRTHCIKTHRVSLKSGRHDKMCILQCHLVPTFSCVYISLIFSSLRPFPSFHPSSIVSLYQFIRCNNIDTQTPAHEISFCSSMIRHCSLRRYHLIITDTSTLAQETHAHRPVRLLIISLHLLSSLRWLYEFCHLFDCTTLYSRSTST